MLFFNSNHFTFVFRSEISFCFDVENARRGLYNEIRNVMSRQNIRNPLSFILKRKLRLL